MINVLSTQPPLVGSWVAGEWGPYNGVEVYDALVDSLADAQGVVLGAWDLTTGEQVSSPVADIGQISGGSWHELHLWMGQASRIV